jgi:adenine-specific DNA-methyltransferase
LSRLSDLLAQVQRLDPQLATDLGSEVKALSQRRQFGLNFERHQPEAVELPGRPVRRGDKVRVLPPRDGSAKADPQLWHVARVADGAAALVSLAPVADGEAPETASIAPGNLVVVAEFRDPIFPGLTSVERIERGGDTPFHAVINGENFHALQALTYTHEASVDAIYIDPPYNTGNQGWIYNDAYVAADDVYKHSKWLAFMERRLLLAKRLLKPTGVIIVAIGDDEHHRLRMLMDQVFGAENFISDVVWQGGRKNDSRYVSNGADYMLIYAEDQSVMSEAGIRWRELRGAHEEMLTAGAMCWQQAGNKSEEATRLMKDWIRSLPDGHEAKLNNRFYEFEPGSGRVFRKKDVSWPGGGGPRYDVLHPNTGKPVRVPSRGWIYSNPARMAEEIAQGRILFGPDESHFINRKLYLDEADSMAAESVFAQKRTSAGNRLQRVLGDKRFPFPKDHEVLMRWLRLVAPKDAVILDFFGGSGSTTEAVMRLNAEDGGTRRSILVTNNEVSADDAKRLRKDGHRHGDPEWEERGVFEYVARPRISTVVTGTRPDGSTYSDGLEQNVEFFHLTYEQPRVVRHGRSFEAIAPLLWLKAGARGRRIDKAAGDYDVAEAYGVLFNLDATAPFVAALLDQPTAQMAFIVSDDERAFQMVCDALPAHVAPVRLYESYLRNFEIGGGL